MIEVKNGGRKENRVGGRRGLSESKIEKGTPPLPPPPPSPAAVASLASPHSSERRPTKTELTVQLLVL